MPFSASRPGRTCLRANWATCNVPNLHRHQVVSSGLIGNRRPTRAPSFIIIFLSPYLSLSIGHIPRAGTGGPSIDVRHNLWTLIMIILPKTGENRREQASEYIHILFISIALENNRPRAISQLTWANSIGRRKRRAVCKDTTTCNVVVTVVVVVTLNFRETERNAWSKHASANYNYTFGNNPFHSPVQPLHSTMWKQIYNDGRGNGKCKL